MKKPEGHKASCRCPFCKAYRKSKGGKKGGKRSAKKRSGHDAAAARRHARELRTQLREAKAGEKAASRNGDASSWAKFKASRLSIESKLRRK